MVICQRMEDLDSLDFAGEKKGIACVNGHYND